MDKGKIIQMPTKYAINTSILNNLNDLKEKLEKDLGYIDEDIQKAKKEKHPYNPKSLKRGFDGAGITIISNESKRNLELESWYGYIIVKTKYVKEITWMLFKLKRICVIQIEEYGVRKDFFQSVAITANGEISKEKDLKVILLSMIDNAEAFITAPF